MNNFNRIFNLIVVVIIVSFYSCSSIPKGVAAVSPFEKEKYLGKRHEIARFDFKLKKGLNNTTAEYTLQNDGRIEVTN